MLAAGLNAALSGALRSEDRRRPGTDRLTPTAAGHRPGPGTCCRELALKLLSSVTASTSTTLTTAPAQATAAANAISAASSPSSRAPPPRPIRTTRRPASALEQAQSAAPVVDNDHHRGRQCLERERPRWHDRLSGTRAGRGAQHAPRRRVTASVGAQPASRRQRPARRRDRQARGRRRSAHQRPGAAHCRRRR